MPCACVARVINLHGPITHGAEMDTITILSARFANRAVIKAEEIYDVITPRPKNPRRTAIEAISRGDFPAPTIKINNRRYVRLVDLAELIDSAVEHNAADNHVDHPAKRRPGRPRKIVWGAP